MLEPRRGARVLRGLAAGLLLICAGSGALAQDAPPVRYTEVVDHEVRRTVTLPGSVASMASSVVASGVAAVVVEVAVQEGDAVRKRQPLARLRAKSFELRLAAAAGRLKEAEARLSLAASKLARSRDLFEEEIISQDQLDDALAEQAAWQGRVDQTTAEIDELRDRLERSVIRAPFAGIVTRKITEVGEWVQVGGAVVELVSLSELEVRVEVPERYYTQLIASADAAVSIESLPGLQITGRVAGIVPQADARARSFPVRVVIPNDAGRVGAGMLARVSLPIGETYHAMVVPKDAVVRQGPAEIVFRINGDDTVEVVPVRSAQGVGPWIVVEGPVEAGQRVVTRGNERLRPGQTVQGEALEYPLP
jgi:RND family efflux transporter MFP subunit